MKTTNRKNQTNGEQQLRANCCYVSDEAHGKKLPPIKLAMMLLVIELFYVAGVSLALMGDSRHRVFLVASGLTLSFAAFFICLAAIEARKKSAWTLLPCCAALTPFFPVLALIILARFGLLRLGH